MWQEIYRAGTNTEAKYAAAFWGLIVGGLALSIGVTTATRTAPIPEEKAAMRNVAGAVSLCMLGSAGIISRPYKMARRANQLAGEVVSRNHASWVQATGQPTQQTIRQIQSDVEASAPIVHLPLFDWSELADSDQHPTLAIISPMGGGKSRLAKFLARHVLFPGMSPQIRALDIYGRAADWQDATLITQHAAMLRSMASDLDLIGERIDQYRKGQDDFTPLFWIFEEAPDTIGTLRKFGESRDERSESDQLVTAWVTKCTTVARKVKARLCLVSVRLSGAEIGVSAEARNDATIIFPGRKGIAKAMADDRIFKLGSKQNSQLREQLMASLEGIARPALVYSDGQWFPAEIPELDAAGNPPGYQQQQLPPGPMVWDAPMADPRDQLEALYQAASVPDREPMADDADPDWLNTIREMKVEEGIEKFDLLLEAILKLSRSDGAIKARHIHQRFTQFKCYSADEIRAVFLMLEDMGAGETVGDGNTLGFAAYPKD